MGRRPLGAAALLWCLAFAPGVPGDDATVLSSRVGEALRLSIELGQTADLLEAGGDRILDPVAVQELYSERGFEPAWTSDSGPLPLAAAMMNTLRSAESHGLRFEDYHGDALVRLGSTVHRDLDAGRQPQVSTLASLDLLLTDAALLYARHLAVGKSDPARIHTQWRIQPESFDPVPFLRDALAAGDLQGAFHALLPRNPAYARLEESLAQLRRDASSEGWSPVPDGEAPLEPGDESERVPALAARLAASGDLPAELAERAGNVYDEELAAAVEAFQRRHGLEPDRVVGRRTLAALNVPVERRIDQIRVNLERWRWLPRDLGARRVEVNIAGFRLRVVEDGRTVLPLRVIVGKRYTRTPVFSASMTYLVLNPYWNVPASIARGEILPDLQADPSYLTRNRYRLFTGSGPGASEVDPASVDWSQVTARDFSYFVRQEPGAGNSLGRVKFMFPNPYSVYLHDTPQRALFDRAQRIFSHGCIRVEKPVELAAFLLRDDPDWTAERIQQVIDSGQQRTLTLAEPVPVHVLYWTAWIDDEGTVQWREDVYDRDPPVLQALDRSPVMR